MYYGTDPPLVNLFGDADPIQGATYLLPQPTKRSDNMYVDELTSDVNVRGKIVIISQFYRYKQRFTFINLSQLNADYLMRIANWKEGIRVYPHKPGSYGGDGHGGASKRRFAIMRVLDTLGTRAFFTPTPLTIASSGRFPDGRMRRLCVLCRPCTVMPTLRRQDQLTASVAPGWMFRCAFV